MDNIIDKENWGICRDGLFVLGWYVGFFLFVGVVIIVVKVVIFGIKLII